MRAFSQVSYFKTIVPARSAQDGETPSVVVATEEVNGYAVHFDSFESGLTLVAWFYKRDGKYAAIEFAVDWGREATLAYVRGLPIPEPVNLVTGGGRGSSHPEGTGA